MSATTVATVPPVAMISAASTCRSLSVRASRPTLTPSAASARATARPMPLPAPVTRATFPCRDSIIELKLEELYGYITFKTEPGLGPDRFSAYLRLVQVLGEVAVHHPVF